MILTLDDYVDRDVDPTAPFVPLVVHDQLLESTNPVATLPESLAGDLARAQTSSALRLQQHLVYQIGQKLGVLAPAVPKVREALRLVPSLTATAESALVHEAVETAIGIASDAMSAVPLYGWLVKCSLGVADIIIRFLRTLTEPGDRIGGQLAAADRYRTDADTSLANDRVITQSGSRDWTSLFLPSMKGELAGQVRHDDGDRIVIAWGLREDGKVPRVVIDSRLGKNAWDWHFSEGGGAGFDTTGGLGAVPGAPRIVSVVQSTLLEPGNIHRGHESLGDPRCGSSGKTADIDTGTWFPSSANGAASLFGYCTRAGAPAYTIATQEVLSAWQRYVDAIWEGIERLWRNEMWESGWGCGPWQNALQGLARAHCVGADGQIGTFGAWAPTRYQTKLTAADRNAWEANNLCTRVVKPAMIDLREMQLALLRKTPMAAYLQATGLGSMRDVSVKEAFERARALILTGRQAKGLRRTDVLDPWYERMLERQGVGSDTGDGGISDSDYRPPRVAMPSGGGRGAIILGVGLVGAAALGLAIRARRRR